MRVNSINNTNYNISNPSFKKTAVPYPEFANAYVIIENPIEDKITLAIDKLSKLFTPKVTREAAIIKADIDSLYPNSPKKEAKHRLLSVLA